MTVAAVVFPFRRLAVWLGVLVTAVALLIVGIATVFVVPSLRTNLIDDRLRAVVVSVHQSFSRFRFNDPAAVSQYESSTGYRVSVMRVYGQVLSPFAGSMPGATTDTITLDVLRSRTERTGVVDTEDRRFAEYALPAYTGTGSARQEYILLFGAPLSDIDRTVETIERRLLVAVAIAVPVALLVGALAALALAERIRRIERAAARIAAGDFTRPVVDRGRDEIASLASAFDDMRVRLERTDRARREFIASASHELRTPIFALGGFLELLEDEDDPGEQREYIATMGDQVKRLTRLATDLLDLSRLDAGVELRHEEVHLGAVAEMTVQDFAPAAEQRGSSLVAGDGEGVAFADEVRVAQICRVLVDNALRHNPPGTHVEISAATSGAHVVLSVADDGPAIAADARDRLFDRFYRGPASGEGSGLGLAIARELALRMGGALELQQDPDGKAFRLVLPAPEDATHLAGGGSRLRPG